GWGACGGLVGRGVGGADGRHSWGTSWTPTTTTPSPTTLDFTLAASGGTGDNTLTAATRSSRPSPAAASTSVPAPPSVPEGRRGGRRAGQRAARGEWRIPFFVAPIRIRLDFEGTLHVDCAHSHRFHPR